MTRIAMVSLALNPKSYWFDAGDLEIRQNDSVVVRTTHGIELGRATKDAFEAEESQISALSSPLKPVVRVATDEDHEQYEENLLLGKQSLPDFKAIANRYNEDMHPVAIEFSLDRKSATFYFEADHRVDFRDMVKELASFFRVRVDMRQIGARDEASIIGGYGHCGQELCCKRLGCGFSSVSIRMAKEQNLSLNPEKISGCCGRLMCCLRYEYDNYKGFNKRAPKMGSTVHTPDGDGKVSHIDALREVIDIRIQVDSKDKTVHVPLSGFLEREEPGMRPNTVGEEAWEEALRPPEVTFESSLFFTGSTSNITGSDKLGEAKAVRRNRANSKNITGSSSMVEQPAKAKRKRRRRGSESSFKPTAEELAAVESSAPKRRRRSVKVSAEGSEVLSSEERDAALKTSGSQGDASKRDRRSRQRRPKTDSESGKAADGSKKAVRPGQKSSGLAASRNGEAASEEKPARRRRRRGGRGRGGNANADTTQGEPGKKPTSDPNNE